MAGYNFEEHTVNTLDGYILTVHRLFKKETKPEKAKKRPVVFM